MNKIRLLSKIFTVLTLLLAGSACNKAPETDKLKISYEKYIMPNGLQVIFHTDHSDPMISYASCIMWVQAGKYPEKPDLPISLNTCFSVVLRMLLLGNSIKFLKEPEDK